MGLHVEVTYYRNPVFPPVSSMPRAEKTVTTRRVFSGEGGVEGGGGGGGGGGRFVR